MEHPCSDALSTSYHRGGISPPSPNCCIICSLCSPAMFRNTEPILGAILRTARARLDQILIMCQHNLKLNVFLQCSLAESSWASPMSRRATCNISTWKVSFYFPGRVSRLVRQKAQPQRVPTSCFHFLYYCYFNSSKRAPTNPLGQTDGDRSRPIRNSRLSVLATPSRVAVHIFAIHGALL